MSVYEEVYGLKYSQAEGKMRLLSEDLRLRQGKAFSSIDELKSWAHDHSLDKVAFSNMGHTMLMVSHKGEIMTPAAYRNYYGNILYYIEQQGNKLFKKQWVPEGFEYFDRSYIVGEQGDGLHKPLYYRDYTVPTGYYNETRDAFNVARPFPCFAKETGRDTSHIYTYIEHIAGECAWHLLAWLRAKLLYPTVKTQVVPIIVSKAQGSGKTTFAEVICKGLFGKENVLVTDQYDATARFNADYADALIVCQEEKEQEDRKNPANTLKSRATATTIRKENKGHDPVYQDSYTDFVLTTNKDVPIKFEGREDQRRFMVMEADGRFTRKLSKEADEVFTLLYGYDSNFNKVGTPFVEDNDLIAQFKHELFTRTDIASVNLRDFPHTAAYHKCFSIPRTTEQTEVESILRSIAPFVKESLKEKKIVEELVLDDGEQISLEGLFTGANIPFTYVEAYKERPAYVAVCRPLVFFEHGSSRPMAHSTVERCLVDSVEWLEDMYGLKVMADTEPFALGFPRVSGRYRQAPVARFCLADDMPKRDDITPDVHNKEEVYAPPEASKEEPPRKGRRFTVDGSFKPARDGEFETVNELSPRARSLKDKTDNVMSMDTFLLESDEPTAMQKRVEDERILEWKMTMGNKPIPAEFLFKERLGHALEVSRQLFDEGKVCRIVYSGSKSYHLLVRVADPPNDLNEYKWLHGWLCNSMTDRLNFDKSTSDPARLTRSPITKQRLSTIYKGTDYEIQVAGKQELVCYDFSHVYQVDWRPFYEQWKGRPVDGLERKGHPLYPTKPEYKEAAEAVLSGEFWTDSKYDGDRQRLFFPAYRLLRAMGWSHDELWDDVIEQGLGGYKKRQDVSYWKTRATSELVLVIDRDIDRNEEGLRNGKARVD